MFILIQFIFISHRHPHTFTTCTLCKPLPLMKAAASCRNVGYFKENLWLVISAREPCNGFLELLKRHAKKRLAVRGDSITVQHKESNTTISLWQDSHPVIVIANNVDCTVTGTVKRIKKNGTRETFPCPSSIALYNRFMGGVDHYDQLRGYYNTPIKCRKYCKYIFWFLVDVAIVNAFILCKEFSSLEILNWQKEDRTS